MEIRSAKFGCTHALPVDIVRRSAIEAALDVVQVRTKELVQLSAVRLEAFAVLVDTVFQVEVDELLSQYAYMQLVRICSYADSTFEHAC